MMHMNLLDHTNGIAGGTAGCEHGVCDHNGALFNRRGEFAVVFNRLVGLRIAVQTDMAYLSGRNKSLNAVNHAETCAEYRHDRHLSAGNDRRRRAFKRGLDLNILGLQIRKGLVAHQHADFLDQAAKFIGSGRLVAETGNLMLYQRVAVYKYFSHV